MAKKFNGIIPFASVIRPTGGQPLDDRTVVQSLTDLYSSTTFDNNGSSVAYNGMLVSVLDEQKTYMLINKNDITNEASWVAVGSGNGSVAVEKYGEAVELATAKNIGQIIYVTTKSSYPAEGDLEEGQTSTEYDAAPYIVTGDGTLMKLASSVASGDINTEISELQTKLSEVSGKTDTNTSGLTELTTEVELISESLSALTEQVNNIEVPVTDVTVNGTSVLDEDGVAKIDLTSYETVANVDSVRERVKDLEDNKVDKVDGSSLMTDVEHQKLSGISEGAQVNVIEKIKVNGSEITVSDSDKSVDITIPSDIVQGVTTKDGQIITLTDDGLLDTTLELEYVSANPETNTQATLRLKGVDGAVVSSIDATTFVKDGMVQSVKLDGPKDNETGKKYLEITWNTDSGIDIVRLDVSDLFNPYKGGSGIHLSGDTFSVKLKQDEEYLEVSGNGLGTTTALWNKVKELDNTVLSAATATATTLANTAEQNAKTYADGLNTAMDGRVTNLESSAHTHDNKTVLDGITSDKVNAWDNAEQNAKDYADDTFVSKTEFEPFEEKLSDISEGAQVNVIENIKVNGVEGTVDEENKVTELTITTDNISLGTEITGSTAEDIKYNTGDTISEVLQGIQNSVIAAVNGSLQKVEQGDGITVTEVSQNKQTVSVNISKDEGNLIKISETDKGIFAAMYYEGDDIEG